MKKEKSFDAVATVRKIRETYHKQTKDMTEEERLAFYREEGGKAQKELARLAKQMPKSEA